MAGHPASVRDHLLSEVLRVECKVGHTASIVELMLRGYLRSWITPPNPYEAPGIGRRELKIK